MKLQTEKGEVRISSEVFTKITGMAATTLACFVVIPVLMALLC